MPNVNLNVDKKISREIWGVAYIALAILTVLSIQGSLGVFGVFWRNVLEPIFGWGIFAVPFLLGFMGLGLFFSKKVHFGVARMTGITLLTASVLSILHLSVPFEDMYDFASLGSHGGYIGFVGAFLASSFIGKTGSYVVFVAGMMISILLSFEVSLSDIIKLFVPSKAVKKQVKKGTKAIHEAIEDVTDKTVDAGINIIKEAVTTTDEAEDEGETIQIQEVDVDSEEELIPGGSIVEEDYDWEFPSLDLLDSKTDEFDVSDKLLIEKAEVIRDKFEQFGIHVTMKDVHVGPTVIQFTLAPAEGVKLSKITTLKKDLALALASRGVRIEAPIPGKSLVGIEVPNEERAIIRMRELMASDEYKSVDSSLKLAIGRDVAGKPLIADLAKMPHLLVAGATGSGKSVGMNSFLISLLYNNSPKDLKLIMIDPKRVELGSYNGIPHLLTPVITDPDKASTALRWAVAEMNRRYQVCAEAGHRNIDDYNADKNKPENLPKIVIVIDELADLMMTAGKEVEASICRLAQMARAVGIHLIIATQRPSVDVITGLIKANIPTRIAFTVSSSIDSRTILDGQGAEDLLGQGDMLYLGGTMGEPVRVQGLYISTKEIERVTNKIKLTIEPSYNEAVTGKSTAKLKLNGLPNPPKDADDLDEMYEQALECIKKTGRASASNLQRYLQIGYNRASRIIDQLEQQGVVGPPNGAKPRDVFL